MKKIFLTLAVFVMALCANAQTNQYFWYNGHLMMGNPIAQIDSVTFGEGKPADTLHILLPRTIIKEVHDTTEIVIHDTMYITNYSCIPEGSLTGEFSVSEMKKVRFSKGSLQYQASTDTWRFAESQWDYVGNASLGTVYENDVKCSNTLISSIYSGWIDLFGYSTENTFFGVSTSMNNNNYSGEFVDWGTNPIINGGNEANLWRTFSKSEWEYMCSSRINANQKIAKATVNGVYGLIILPDEWNCPSTLLFNANMSNWNANVYSSNDWKDMESAGAIFLPATGYRNGTTIDECQTDGHIWTSGVYHAWFNQTSISTQSRDLYSGRSVRLVQDVSNTNASSSESTNIVHDTVKTVIHDTIEVVVYDTIYINKCEEHEYVDLGLTSGTLWATCNIGANAPEESGFYFLWGETDSTTLTCTDMVEGRSSKYLDCYNQCVRKYSTTASTSCSGLVDNLLELESIDDAATVNWGNEWQTPSVAEWTELVNQCTWTWKSINGKSGYEIVGTNGNKIFIPASGHCRWSTSVTGVGTAAGLWSRDVQPDSWYAYSVYFTSTYVIPNEGIGRSDCQAIRPVRKQH